MLCDMRLPFTSLRLSIVASRSVTCAPGWWVDRDPRGTVVCLGPTALLIDARERARGQA